MRTTESPRLPKVQRRQKYALIQESSIRAGVCRRATGVPAPVLIPGGNLNHYSRAARSVHERWSMHLAARPVRTRLKNRQFELDELTVGNVIVQDGAL